MENGIFCFRNSLCAYEGKWNWPHQVFKEHCKLSAWLTDFQGCALPEQNSKQEFKSSVLACWWCTVNKTGIGHREDEQVPGACVCMGELTSTFWAAKALQLYKNTAGPCLVHRVVQGWSSAKIPTESKDKGMLRKVSFIFTALICDQCLKTLLYLQNPVSIIHSYPTYLIETFKDKLIFSKTVHFYP